MELRPGSLRGVWPCVTWKTLCVTLTARTDVPTSEKILIIGAMRFAYLYERLSKIVGIIQDGEALLLALLLFKSWGKANEGVTK